MSFHSMMPNQPISNPIRETKAQKKAKNKKREEISGQLKLNFLRDKLLDMGLVFLLDPNQYITQDDEIQDPKKRFALLVNSLNEQRFEDLCEERMSMKKCQNIWCNKDVPDDFIRKSKSLKFVISKDKGCEMINSDKPFVFCSGESFHSLSPKCSCIAEFKKMQHQVLKLNEGGPFGTPMRDIILFMKTMSSNPNIHEIDHQKIKNYIKEFEDEIGKVSVPIKENKFEVVKSRVVDPKDGNPQDLNFKGKEKNDAQKAAEKKDEKEKTKTCKMNVISNRDKIQQQANYNSWLKTIKEEPKEPPKQEEVKEKPEETKKVTNLSTGALDYLDNLIFENDEEEKEDQEQAAQVSAPPIRNPQPVPVVKQVQESKKFEEDNKKADAILDKSVIKKKVRFSEQTEELSQDQEDVTGYTQEEELLGTIKKQGQVTDQISNLFEEEIEKEKLAATAVQEESSSTGTGYETDPYGSEFDAQELAAMIEEEKQNQSSFGKLFSLAVHMTNYTFKQFVQKNGDVNPSNSEADYSQVKEFFQRQLKQKIFNLKEYKQWLSPHPDPKVINQTVSYQLQRAFKFLSLETLTTSISDAEWVTLAKIFLKVILKIMDEQNDFSKFLETIQLENKERLLYESYTGDCLQKD